jgi:hypothetical protein
MKLWVSVLRWLLIVGGFVGLGILAVEDPRPPTGPESGIAFGSVGVGIASSVEVGLCIVRKVRSRRMPPYLAAVLLLWSSFLSILVPIPIISAIAAATRYRESDGGYHLFQGEHAQAVFVVAYGFWFAVTALIVFVIWVFSVPKSSMKFIYNEGQRWLMRWLLVKVGGPATLARLMTC